MFKSRLKCFLRSARNSSSTNLDTAEKEVPLGTGVMGQVIAIQDRSTGMFYAGEHLWVSDVSGATTFPTTQDAIAHVLSNEIEDAEIFVAGPDSEPPVIAVHPTADEPRI